MNTSPIITQKLTHGDRGYNCTEAWNKHGTVNGQAGSTGDGLTGAKRSESRQLDNRVSETSAGVKMKRNIQLQDA